MESRGSAMQRRTLGRTGLDVPVIGLGGVGLNQPAEGIIPVVDRALERGADFIHMYPDQEEKMGSILAGKRDRFTVATHVDVYADPDRRMGTAEQIMDRVDTCLTALQTDRVELFQFHPVMTEEALSFIQTGGALEGLKKAQAQGKVRYIGITGHNSPPLVAALKSGDFDTVMVPFNIMRRDFGADPSIGLFPLARQMDIGVIIMKPIASGRITRHIPEALQFILAHDVSLAIPGSGTLEQRRGGGLHRPLRGEEAPVRGRAGHSRRAPLPAVRLLPAVPRRDGHTGYPEDGTVLQLLRAQGVDPGRGDRRAGRRARSL